MLAGGHMARMGCGGEGGYRGAQHRLKFNTPYQHKKEHMSFALVNYCHIEQFKHMIRTKYTLRETGKLGLQRLLTATALDQARVPQCADGGGILCPRRSGEKRG